MKNVKKFFLLSCAIYCTACSGNGNTGNHWLSSIFELFIFEVL